MKFGRHTEPAELPSKVLDAIEETTIASRTSGTLIIGLGAPFFFESIDTAIKSRLAEYALDKHQLKLAADLLRRHARQEAVEIKNSIRSSNRSERSPWSNNWRWNRH